MWRVSVRSRGLRWRVVGSDLRSRRGAGAAVSYHGNAMKLARIEGVILALAVFTTSAQCLIACNTDFCLTPKTTERKLPPCHRHSAPKQDGHAPQGCAHPVFVAEGRTATAISVEFSPTIQLLSLPVQPILPSAPAELVSVNASPPGFQNPDRFTILRI